VKNFLFAALAFFLFAGNGMAAGLSTRERLQDFEQLKSLIQSQYGPFAFKQATGVIKWDELNSEFEERIKATRTNQEFYTAISQYVANFQDGHFGVYNNTKRGAAVPFLIDLIEGKPLISYIDREKLPKEKFDFEIGDEIITVDGEPAQAFMDNMLKSIASGNRLSAKRRAAWTITSRNGALFPVPAKPQLELTIRRGTSTLIDGAKADWVKKGTVLDEEEAFDPLLQQASFGESQTSMEKLWDARDRSLDLFENPTVDRRYSCNPDTRVQVPADAEWVMKKPITAYTYSTAKGRVGYVRIQDYYPVGADGKISSESVRNWFEKLRFVMREMEKKTVGLVIDQNHNCGGSVSLVEDVVSLFISKAELPMLFQFRASKAAYLKNVAELETMTPETLDHAFGTKFVALLEEALKGGRGSMTKITPITRELVFPEREAAYTKPVVILIDDQAGSGGDAFPSIMKGIGRAKLLGQQTAGLGGSVEGFAPLNHSQMEIRMTVSLFFKPDQSPVENNGAIPDEYYTETRDDLIYKYRPLQQAYTDYLLKQLP
jgi:hypothetical protein